MNPNSQDHLEHLLNNQSDSNFQNASEIYWNDQNEEVFLQNLFANTLLNDNFSVEDNLNYTASVSQNLSDTSLQINNNIVPSLNNEINLLSQKSPDLVAFESMSDFVINLDTSFNLTDQLNFNQIDPENFLLKQNIATNNLKSINLVHESVTSKESSHTEEIFLLEPADNILSTTNLVNIIPLQSEITQNDDNLFKKPTTILSSYFHSLSNINTQESSGSVKSSTQKSYQKIFKKNKLTESDPTELLSQFRKINNESITSLPDYSISSCPRPIIDQKIQMDSAFENDLSSSENNESRPVNIPNSLSSSPSSFTKIVNSTPSPIAKLLTLKRSRKRSKQINATTTLLDFSQKVNIDMSQKLLVGTKQTKLNSGVKKLNKKDNKKEKKQKQQNQSNSNFEPLSKKFAVDKSKKNILSTNNQPLKFQGLKFLNTNNIINKEEVDLDIKELSLLDLHSSEDDSNERFASNLQKNIRQLVNLPVKTSKTIPIISISGLDTGYSKSSYSSFGTVTKADACVTNNGDSETTNQLNRLKDEWKKSSIDSDSGVSTKSSTDSLNSKKKLKQSKSIISLLSNSHDDQKSTQNKRKKQNNSGQYTCNIDNQVYIDTTNLADPNIELVVNSISLDNDTLQNMKNLDLNQDLSNDSIKPSTSSLTENPMKYIKGEVNVIKETTPVKIVSLGNTSLSLDLNEKKSRETLWDLLISHSSTTEMLDNFGSALHDKISFWDLVQLKIKHSKNKNELNTIYEITDDYTKLYSNMSTLLEGFVKEHSQEGASSRSRSSSRNYRK